MTDAAATTPMPPDSPDYVPVRRPDVDRVPMGTESVAWSPIRDRPVYLDPVANVLYDVLDGEASVAQLADDVVAELGIDHAVALQQVGRVSQLLHGSGLLVDSLEVGGQSPPTAWFGYAHDN